MARDPSDVLEDLVFEVMLADGAAGRQRAARQALHGLDEVQRMLRSCRQGAVEQLLDDGYTQSAAAGALGVSRATVRRVLS